MKHEIIKTDNYLLVVDESEIKEGDWYYYENGKTLKGVEQVVNGKITKTMVSKKIISHLSLNGSPILEGVSLLPPLPNEDDEIIENLENYLLKVNKLYKDWLGIGFKGGYHKAKEKYKYTEEDLRKAWNAAYIDAMSIDEETYKPLFYEDFIQSLSQPKIPIGFECVTETRVFDTYPETRTINPKKTTTPEGHTQWVGKYIYEVK